MPKAIEQAAAILEKLGVDEDVITTLKSEDQKAIDELKPDEVSKSIIETQKHNLENDEDFKKPIETAVRGAIMEQKEREYMKINPGLVTAEEFAKLPLKDRFTELMKLGARKQAAKGASDDNKELLKTIDDLNATVVEKDEKLKQYEEEILPKAKTEGEERYNQLVRNQTVESEFQKTLGDKLIAKSSLLFPAIRSELESKYDVVIEDGVSILYEKGKKTKATKNSKPISLAQAFEDIATASDVIKKQPAVPPKDKLTEKGEPVKKFELKGTDKLDAEIKRREAAAIS